MEVQRAATGPARPGAPASTPGGPAEQTAQTGELTTGAKRAPAARPTPPARPAPVPTAAMVTAARSAGTSSPPSAARPTPPDRTGSGGAPARPQAPRPQGPRRARLLLTRLDPWSVMKTFFMLSLAVAIVLVVATAALWWTLDVTGVFAAVNRTVDDVVGGSTPFDFLAVAGFGRVMGAALVLSAIEIVLMSAMATLFAFLYNLTVGFTRGLEVTLTEDS